MNQNKKTEENVPPKPKRSVRPSRRPGRVTRPNFRESDIVSINVKPNGEIDVVPLKPKS